MVSVITLESLVPSSASGYFEAIFWGLAALCFLRDTVDDAAREIGAHINGYYNSASLHSSLGLSYAERRGAFI